MATFQLFVAVVGQAHVTLSNFSYPILFQELSDPHHDAAGVQLSNDFPALHDETGEACVNSGAANNVSQLKTCHTEAEDARLGTF